MTDLELLKRSCERLPRLIELESPANLIVNEMQILSGLSFHLLGEAVGREVQSRLEEWGMSLRDWFAGQALAGMMADPNVGADVATGNTAYMMADAMLEARGK